MKKLIRSLIFLLLLNFALAAAGNRSFCLRELRSSS